MSAKHSEQNFQNSVNNNVKSGKNTKKQENAQNGKSAGEAKQ